MSRLVSVVVPVYNEAQNLERLHTELRAVLESSSCLYEIVFVNDGSTDESAAVIDGLTGIDSRVRSIEFSRNFGKEAATSAGIAEGRGDAIIMIDADLQHPPSLITSLIREWEKGAEVVIGVRASSAEEGFVRRLGSRLFALIMNAISDISSPAGATDFRLIDRIVADVFNRMTERRRLTRSLIDWLGFRRAFVLFDAPKRVGGKGRYRYGRLIAAAFSAIVAHSRIPLMAAGYLGGVITVLAGLLGVFLVAEQFLLKDPLGLNVTGTGFLALMIVFLNGIVLICLGLIALYIGTIHDDVAGRPLYVVRRFSSKEGAHI